MSTAVVYPVTITFPDRNPGEKYAGVIISPDGKYRHHLVLLPQEVEPNKRNSSRTSIGPASSASATPIPHGCSTLSTASRTTGIRTATTWLVPSEGDIPVFTIKAAKEGK